MLDAEFGANIIPARLFGGVLKGTLTIKRLYPFDVICWQHKTVNVSVVVHRVHEGTEVLGMA